MLVHTQINRPAHRNQSEPPQAEPPAPDDPNCGLVTDLVCVGGGTLLGAGAGLLGGAVWAMNHAAASGGSSQLGQAFGIITLGPPLAMVVGGAAMVVCGLAGGGLGIALANHLRDC